MLTNKSKSSNINKTIVIQPLEVASTTISACTRVFTNSLQSCDNDDIEINNGINVNGVIYSGGTDLLNIIKDQITDNDVYLTGATFSGATLNLKTRGGNIIQTSFTGNTSGDCLNDLYVNNLIGCDDLNVHSDVVPNEDDKLKIGTPIRRFREVNTYSGTTTIWVSTNRIETPSLNLGLDSQNNTRIITANNSIIQDDEADGGTY